MPKKFSRLIDISARLYDLHFFGFYNLEQVHEDDFDAVLKRAWEQGIEKIIVPARSLFNSFEAHGMSVRDNRIYYTVGCHPLNYYKEYRDLLHKTTSYPQDLSDFYQQNKGRAVAFGLFGLDYERMYVCPKKLQIEYFNEQLNVATSLGAPLYLECRDAFEDFMKIMLSRNQRFRGIIHSFNGTISEAKQFLQLGLDIGIDGSAFKTVDTMEVLKSIPNRRILIGTQSPEHDVSITYEGYNYVRTKFDTVRREEWNKGMMVKFRNEPARLCQILEMLAGLKEERVEDMENIVYENTINLFFQ